MAETAAKKKNLKKKINAVTAGVKLVKKDGHNDFHNYDYLSEAGAIQAVNELLAENGVGIWPTVRGNWQVEREVHTKDGIRLNVHSFALVDFTIFDEESDEEMTSTWIGEGVDSGDKGYYKAYTGAFKYFLMKTFRIPTGDDPESDNGKESQTIPRKSNPATASKTISVNQAKLLHVVLGKANVDPDTVKAFYQVEHLDELDKGQMDEVISDLERKGKVVKDGTGRYQTPEEAVTEDIDVPVEGDNVPW